MLDNFNFSEWYTTLGDSTMWESIFLSNEKPTLQLPEEDDRTVENFAPGRHRALKGMS